MWLPHDSVLGCCVQIQLNSSGNSHVLMNIVLQPHLTKDSMDSLEEMQKRISKITGGMASLYYGTRLEILTCFCLVGDTTLPSLVFILRNLFEENYQSQRIMFAQEKMV